MDINSIWIYLTNPCLHTTHVPTLAPSYPWALISLTERPTLWMVSRNFVVSSSALVPLSACTKVRNSSRMRCFPSSFLPTKRIQIEICSLFVTSVDSSAINA